ncbi:hypothetical protein STEG23_009912, partial [Scotinomys teguina]
CFQREAAAKADFTISSWGIFQCSLEHMLKPLICTVTAIPSLLKKSAPPVCWPPVHKYSVAKAMSESFGCPVNMADIAFPETASV